MTDLASMANAAAGPQSVGGSAGRPLVADVNDRVREVARCWGMEECEFVCECRDPACVGTVSLSVAEYDAIRRDRDRYLVGPDHVPAGDERAVETTDRHAIFEPLDR